MEKFTKEMVESACIGAVIYRDVAIKLGCTESHAGKLIIKFGINFNIKHGAIQKYTKEIVKTACLKCNTYKEVGLLLGCAKSYASQLIKTFNIKFKSKQKLGTIQKYTEDVVRAACAGSSNYDEVRTKLMMKPGCSQIYTLIKKYKFKVPFKKSGRPDVKGTSKFRKNRKLISNKNYEILLKKTNFLNKEFMNVSYPQRTWHIRNNNFNIQYCICGKLMIFMEKRYKYCSKECTDKMIMSNGKVTFLKNYGVDNPFKSDIIKTKIRNICIAKYGVSNGGVLSNGHYKNYTLPSGRIIRIQGFENKGLDILLKQYDESDILYGPKEIRKELGIFKYTINNNEHKYYPDFFIKSDNKIVEVKSTWTYDRKGYDPELKNVNELKRKSCLDRGFNFEFMIFS